MRLPLLLLIVLWGVAAVAPAPVRAVGGLAPLPVAAPAAPRLSAKAALVREDAEGRTLMNKTAETPLPPASTIKMLTAITALKLGQPGDTVTIVGADLVGGSTMNLMAGDTLTLGNLLHGLLIPSGNDAAMAIARLEGAKLPDAARVGAVPAFVARMNETGVALGLKGTRAINPSGLDAAGQTSTAADLARLADLVLADPVLAPIVRLKEARIPSRLGSYAVKSTNELAGTPGVIGVKTGTEIMAGQNLVLAVNEGNHRLTVVIMGSEDRYADARALLAYARSNWTWLTLGDPKVTPGLARALAAYGVAPGTEGRKTVMFDKPMAARLRYQIALSPQPSSPNVVATPETAANTPANAGSPAQSTTIPEGTAIPPGARGVIIYMLGDREIARVALVVPPPPMPTPAPIATRTSS